MKNLKSLVVETIDQIEKLDWEAGKPATEQEYTQVCEGKMKEILKLEKGSDERIALEREAYSYWKKYDKLFN